ncbi:hypothetical protein PsorP6_011586 [Peronosclerospora sorghi]|uniref:Uncharacterized protein n=1 Tax=Peronosclerospora sorghi TaxID=230839 RepID=A0ACC0WKQ7_9STRA|nr:hypothetical protein PsorP6_011586 [Peronosclerospora sorghi]
MARSNAEIALQKNTYEEMYGEDLVQVLSAELSGDMKKVILTALRGEVAEFGAYAYTSAKAGMDAEVLYEVGEGIHGRPMENKASEAALKTRELLCKTPGVIVDKLVEDETTYKKSQPPQSSIVTEL